MKNGTRVRGTFERAFLKKFFLIFLSRKKASNGMVKHPASYGPVGSSIVEFTGYKMSELSASN